MKEASGKIYRKSANYFGFETRSQRGESALLRKVASWPNEFRVPPTQSLPVLRDVIIGRTDYTPQIQQELDHMIVASDIEIDTPKVNAMQELADKIAEVSDAGPVRLAVLKRGRQANAFALPDGTVLINQQLVNQLSTVDQLAGVLIHEINGHIAAKTFEKTQSPWDSDRYSFGCNWAHETNADLSAPEILSAIGLRSTGLSEALQIITSGERGAYHQSGNMRSAQTMGMHAGKHFGTSDTFSTPLPTDWKTSSIESTNTERFKELVYQKHASAEILKAAFSKLSVLDLREVGKSYRNSKISSAYMHVLTERAQAAGFSATETSLYLLYLSSVDSLSLDIFQDAQMFIDSLEESGREIKPHGRIDTLHQVLFDDPKRFIHYRSSRPIEENIIVKEEPGYMCFTDKSIVSLLATLQSVGFNDTQVSEVFGEYFEQSVEKLYKNRFFTNKERRLHKLFADMKQQGIRLEIDYVRAGTLSKKERQHVFAIVQEYYSFNTVDEMLEAFAEKIPWWTSDPMGSSDLAEFFRTLFYELDKNALSSSEKKALIDSLSMHMSEMQDASTYSIDRFLNGEISLQQIGNSALEGTGDDLSTEDKRRNQCFVAAFAGMVPHLFLANDRDDAYFDSLTDTFTGSGISPQELTLEQLQNIVKLLSSRNNYDGKHFLFGFDIPKHSVGKLASVDYDAFSRFAFVQEIVARKEATDLPDTLEGLYTLVDKRARSASNFADLGGKLFSDSPHALLFFDGIRQRFQELISRGYTEDEGQYVYRFVDQFLQKDATTRPLLVHLAKEFFRSNAPLSEKLVFLEEHLETLSWDGIASLGEEISTPEEYQQLYGVLEDKKDEYLHPGKTTQTIALVDLVSTYLSSRFDVILESSITDAKKSKESSQRFIDFWSRLIVFNPHKFDKKQKQVRINAKTEHSDRLTDKVLITGTDFFDMFTSLPEDVRLGIVLKSLLDPDGALGSEKDRAKLGDIAIDSLDVSEPFLQSVIRSACRVADAKIVGFPLANMLAPLLFRGLDIHKTSVRKIAKDTEHSHKDMKKLAYSSTRDIVRFGAIYRDYPESLFDTWAGECNDSYYETYDIFRNILADATAEPNSSQEVVDPAVDALINGVQKMGAIGPRSLQLAAQLMPFKPAMEKRLSESFDANPGLSKVLFWENLRSFGERAEQGEVAFAASGAFISERLVSVDNKLGGGSLYTTFSGVITDEGEQEKKVVLKMLNPNAVLQIKEFSQLAEDTLTDVRDRGTRSAKDTANKSLRLVKLAKEWCLADISDTDFDRDDDHFRKLLKDYNALRGGELFTTPRRIFTNHYLHVEELAEGTTVNRFLHDENVSAEKKQQSVAQINDLYRYLLFDAAPLPGQPPVYLIPSDPHPGNFIVSPDSNAMNGITHSVIDRNFALHMSEQDMKTLRYLYNGEEKEFLDSFSEVVFEENNITDEAEKKKLRRAMLRTAFFASHKSQANPFHTMQKITSLLEENNLEIPLRMYLGMKNNLALKRLEARYGSSE